MNRLVCVNRILYNHSVVDGLGHASVRHETKPRMHLLSTNWAAGMVRRKDFVCYGYDVNAVSKTAEPPYLECCAATARPSSAHHWSQRCSARFTPR